MRRIGKIRRLLYDIIMDRDATEEVLEELRAVLDHNIMLIDKRQVGGITWLKGWLKGEKD